MAQATRFIHILRASVALVPLLCAACSTAPRVAEVTRDAGDLGRWQVNGRMAVSGAEGGGSGSFIWNQDGDRSVVQLRGPLGVGSLRLTLNGAALRIETGNGDALEAEDAEAELTARLGASVPTQSLRYWLLGRPAPGDHRSDANEQTAFLEQDGWRIDFQRFGVTDGARLPMRFVAINGPAKVRVVVDKWQLQ
jgi:outer membrane lipoprotein LolB